MIYCYLLNFAFLVFFSKQKKRLFGESSVYEYMDGGNQMEMDLTATITPSGDLVSFVCTLFLPHIYIVMYIFGVIFNEM